jgi:undecaprenyl-diphosphatase
MTDLHPLLIAAILGILEGLTEFLPISSTGHLILASSLMNFTGPKAVMFMIVIQGAAILAVMWEYRRRIADTVSGLLTERRAQRFALNVFLAFLPLAVLGLLFKDFFEAHLFKPQPVAVALIVGGFIILWAERRIATGAQPITRQTVDELTPIDALKVGLAQAAALIPGTSRAGATIIGGLFFGLSRRCATEFSFFLAMPTLVMATVYKLWKDRHLLQIDDWSLWAVGASTSFIATFICMRWLLRFVSTHSFVGFAWYRIVFGLAILLTAGTGWVTWYV